MDQGMLDTGTAYGAPNRTWNKRLTEVGAGKPMGELLRRYWQPFYAAKDLTSDVPKRVRLLGEDLIAFRDKQGRPGLVAENCCHRGSSLYYGRIEEDGIRCCYHGWKFDVQGHCLEQACEVGGGRRRDVARQPWYPVQERYGLIYAYMGPPARKPVLPRWESVEGLNEDEFLEVSMYVGFGPKETQKWFGTLDFSWLQSAENMVDPIHATWLHFSHSEPQFLFSNDVKDAIIEARPPSVSNVTMAESRWGLKSELTFTADDGSSMRNSIEVMLPNIGATPGFNDLVYFVPIDDTHHLVIQVGRVTRKGEMEERRQTHGGRDWWDLNERELQQSPGDYEAQRSQGQIAVHSRERLVQSDRGIIIMRRRLEEMLTDMEAGKDPLGVSFDPDEAVRPLEARVRLGMGGAKQAAAQHSNLI